MALVQVDQAPLVRGRPEPHPVAISFRPADQTALEQVAGIQIGPPLVDNPAAGNLDGGERLDVDASCLEERRHRLRVADLLEEVLLFPAVQGLPLLAVEDGPEMRTARVEHGEDRDAPDREGEVGDGRARRAEPASAGVGRASPRR